MRTVAIALPYTYGAEFKSEFSRWCEEQEVECHNTGLEAEVFIYDPQTYYLVFEVTAPEADLVHLKLRWGDEMAEEWELNELERAVAELMFWEVKDRI